MNLVLMRIFATALLLGGCVSTGTDDPHISASGARDPAAVACAHGDGCEVHVSELGLTIAPTDDGHVVVTALDREFERGRPQVGDLILEAGGEVVSDPDQVIKATERVLAKRGRRLLLLISNASEPFRFVSHLVRQEAIGQKTHQTLVIPRDLGKLGISDELRTAIDAELFSSNPLLASKVFKMPYRLQVSFYGSIPESSARGKSTIISLILRSYSQAIGWREIQGVPGRSAPLSLMFTDGACAEICQEELLGYLNEGGSFSGFEFKLKHKNERGTVCLARALAEPTTGVIKAGAAIVDATQNNSMFTFCVLQALYSMLQSTNPADAIDFLEKEVLEETVPENLVPAFMARPEKAAALRLLYRPDIKPGMSAETFWQTIDRESHPLALPAR